MDGYSHQRRFAASGEAPPPPPPPSHHWYPGPAPPYPPRPGGHPFPPQQYQWGPPPDLQHQHHPPPQHQQPYAYQPSPPMPMPPPPPAPANPWPPHHASAQPPPPTYPPPPPGQAWINHSWAQHHGYAGHANDEDWATKAKAWAAGKSVTESHQIQQHAISTSRTEVHNYGYHDQYQQPASLLTELSHSPIPRPSNDQLPFQISGQQRETNFLPDRGPTASPAKSFGSFPSTYEQEVSYNYSSAPGNGNVTLQYPSLQQAHPSPIASSIQDGFPQAPASMPGHDGQYSKMIVDPSDQPLEFNSKKAPDIAIHKTINFSPSIPAAPAGGSNHDIVATSAQSWVPSATVGFFPQAPLPQPGTQMDPSMHGAPLFGAIPGSNYVPPPAFGVGSATEAFPTDANTPFNVIERSKKPPVPNWLREELLKKKSTSANASMQHSTNFDSMESEETEKTLARAEHTDSRSMDSAKSTEDDEDDEDEIEAARMAAINQEIKRVLTEVLLKVTDDLFYEIATKVLNEDDSSTEANEPASFSSSKEPDLVESKVKPWPKVTVPAKPTNISSSDDGIGPSSPKGDLLGLASYDSDDEDENDDDEGKGKVPISNFSSETKPSAVHPEEVVGEKSIDGELHRNHNERNSSTQSALSREDHRVNSEGSKRTTNAGSEGELHVYDTHNGEFSLDNNASNQPEAVVHTMNEKAHGYTETRFQNGKASSGSHAEKHNNAESSHKHLERSSNVTDSAKETKSHRKEPDSSTVGKYNDDDKYRMYGNSDKRGSFKEGKGSSRNTKHESDAREPPARGNFKQDDAKRDPKDARERYRDSADRKGEKEKLEKMDRSRQITKSSTDHRSRRSRSPSERGQTKKESSSHVRGSVSSDEPSDSMKRRRLHSRKNSMSPSPPKSRNRRVSRSPHSKHSHRRHSPYSSADRNKRSRSRTPVRRR